MASKKWTPNDLKDNIYTLGYWMTDSYDGANDLLCRTYLRVTPETPAIEIFKTFRDGYFDSFINGKISCIPKPSSKSIEHMAEELIKQDADLKLTVLLSEIAKLETAAISKIIGRSVDRINSWILSDRAWLVGETLSSNGHSNRRMLLKNIKIHKN
ncbi:MAG: RNA polymerase subunit sigma-24 [Chlorobium sp.]|nr:MAG: RNA polymerase subunit sigma-24 [Chlorobium sp.]